MSESSSVGVSPPSGPARPPRSRWALYLDLIRWDRPAGWLLLLWPTLMALWLAAGGWPGWHLLGVFVLGAILMRSAGCCINDVADRDFDRHVKRTAHRPVTAGWVSVREALAVGAVLALLALGLALTTSLATVLWAVPALAVTVAYPYAKRWFAMPQAVLGVAFGFGIPMAFVAVPSTGEPAAWSWSSAWQAALDLPPAAGWLVLGNLAWVLAFDTAYAMVDRDDDLRIGIRTSAITLGRWDVAVVTGCELVFVVFCGLALGSKALSAPFLVAALLALGQIVWHHRLIRDRQREGCFRAFTVSHWLGATLFAGMAAALAWG